MKNKVIIISIIFIVVCIIGGYIKMADYNIQMEQRNADNTAWDNHYPITKAANVKTSGGNVATDLNNHTIQIADVQTRMANLTQEITGSPVNTYGVLATSSDVYGGAGAVPIIDIDRNLKITLSDSSANHFCFFNINAKKVTFESVNNDPWIILGGNSDDVAVISIGTINGEANLGKIWDVTPNTITNKGNVPSLSGTGVNAGDIVEITTDGQTYVFRLKRSTQSEFSYWFSFQKTNYTAVAGWNNNSNLGILKFGAPNSTVLLKNLQLYMYASMVRYSRWQGLKWDVLGDSITNLNEYQPVVNDLLAFSKINNYGVASSCITGGPTPADSTGNNAFCVRYADMDTTADLVTVFGGVNDQYYSKQIGDINDTGIDTFYGALKTTIEGITEMMPNARIVLITPLQMHFDEIHPNPNALGLTLLDYVDAMKKVGELYGIPVLDLYRNSGINQINYRTYLSDDVHPNASGFDRIGKMIATFLNSL
jgi:lysophospholipase L1-like esterase